MKKRGIFISFEGAEGVGKSTQIELLERFLISEGHRVYRTREPGGTPLGEELRRLFKLHKMSALTELLMVEASRVEHVQQVILPRLSAGEIILSDRYSESSLVYQGILGKLGLKKVQLLNSWATQNLRPDLCVWLDLPAKVIEERLRQRKGAADRFDDQPETFHRAVASAYRKLAKSSRQPKLQRFDASKPAEDLHQEIIHAVKALLRKKKIRC